MVYAKEEAQPRLSNTICEYVASEGHVSIFFFSHCVTKILEDQLI